MGNQLSQMFPPAPTFTEDSLPDLKDKVFIVTGASAGIGKELARLLYSRNGTVYAAARSTEKTTAALAWIKEQHPSSKGKLTHLHLDLNDLEGIKPSVENFLAQESRLDVLINNAGVFMTPLGPKTKQGYEIQLGTNCIAPFLFTKLLTPLLVATAKKEPAGSVRVAWVSSSAADVSAPKGGVDMQNLGYNKNTSTTAKYAVSKGGNILHAIEFRRRYGGEGVVSIVSFFFSIFFFLPPWIVSFMFAFDPDRFHTCVCIFFFFFSFSLTFPPLYSATQSWESQDGSCQSHTYMAEVDCQAHNASGYKRCVYGTFCEFGA